MQTIFDLQTIAFACLVLFSVAAILQLTYFLYYFLRLSFYEMPALSGNLPPVSVVIAARNEYDNLMQFLPIILTQDYPDYEVIVVNDGSWDESEELLTAFQQQYAHLKIVKIRENERFDGGKKLAITVGIKAAKNERLLFTDADCQPASLQWIRKMMGALSPETEIVLGYSPYMKKPGLLNAVVRFETWLTAANYVSYTLAKKPFMGVGRNLSYTSAGFYKVHGFKSHYSLASGDDDLLVNELSTAKNVSVCLDPETHVESIARTTWTKYWRQKRRHLSTSRKYHWKHRLLLGAQHGSLLLLWLSAIGLLVLHSYVYIVGAVLFARLLLQIYIFRRSIKWMGQADLWWMAPILEPMVMVMYTFVQITNLSAKPVKWTN